MKILITGMNKAQCNENFYLQQQLKVIPSHVSLLACLRDMGHDVEQRMVKIGEDLSKYDKVICYLASPKQAIQLGVYNGLWAIHNTNKDKLIFAFDDWQIKMIMNGFRYCVENDSLFTDFIITQSKLLDKSISKESIEPFKSSLIEAAKFILDKKCKVLISAFSGGNLELLFEDISYDKKYLYSYNPNPYHINRQPKITLFQEPKRKEFNYAGLVQSVTKTWFNKLKIQDLSWPLKKYGSRSDGQDRLLEEDMVTLFSQQWGIVMSGYKHAGSGWWRARPLQVADAGSILIGDPKEMMLYYKDERLASIKPIDLVNMTEDELKSFAKAQRDALYANHPLDKEIQKSELMKVLK